MNSGWKNKKMSSLKKADYPQNCPLKPGNYELGSPESRAAARSLAEAKKRPAETIQIVYVSPNGEKRDGPQLKISPV